MDRDRPAGHPGRPRAFAGGWHTLAGGGFGASLPGVRCRLLGEDRERGAPTSSAGTNTPSTRGPCTGRLAKGRPVRKQALPAIAAYASERHQDLLTVTGSSLDLVSQVCLLQYVRGINWQTYLRAP